MDANRSTRQGASARAIGVELEANLVALSVERARDEGVADRVTFLREDLFDADLGAASVITLYISPDMMTRLKQRLLATKPGTRIVSHHFTLDDWPPGETVQTEGRAGYLWIVPADVHGTWAVPMPDGTLRLTIEIRLAMASPLPAGARAAIDGPDLA